MSSAELTELLAYQRIEPCGGPQVDYLAALPVVQQINAQRAETAQPTEWHDLVPWADENCLDALVLDDDASLEAFDRMTG